MGGLKQLTGEVRKISCLTCSEIEIMYSIMQKYYYNTKIESFKNDLQEKKDVILLKELISGEIKGFSTIGLLKQVIDKKLIMALFSGDTIIEKECWGSNKLPKFWFRYVFCLIDQVPQAELYWFLITKGYKTYKFLPLFFHEFYPQYGKNFPEKEKRILDSLAILKFRDHYDLQRGVISFKQEKDYLKEGIADIDEKKMQDVHIKYFVEKNPNWAKGNELACITKLTRENIKSVAHKIAE